MPRFLATSDWHASMDPDMDAELDAAVRQMLPYADDVDAVVIPGDIYHQTSSPGSRLTVAGLVQAFAEKAPVLISKGNHDPLRDLLILARLEAKHPIHVFEDPGEVEIKGCVLVVAPWITKAHWIALHPEDSTAESDLEINKAVLAYLRARRMLIAPGRQCVLVSHLMVAGATLQNHQPFQGTGFQIGQYDAQEAGFTAGIFGHVHKAQHVGAVYTSCPPALSDEKSLFIYPGSPTAQNFGEDASEKVFAILDTDAATVEWRPLDVIDRVTIDAECVDGDLKFNADPERIRGARVRIRYTLPEGEDGVRIRRKAQEALLAYQPLSVTVDPQVRPKEAVRAAAMASAQTYGDKLMTYWEVTGTRPERLDGVLGKLDALLEDVFRGVPA